MKKLRSFLQGKKTMLIAILSGIVYPIIRYHYPDFPLPDPEIFFPAAGGAAVMALHAQGERNKKTKLSLY